MIPRNAERPQVRQQTFVWAEYTGYFIAHTDNGGVGMAKERHMDVEIWLPETAIKYIRYVERKGNVALRTEESDNILLNRYFIAVMVERNLARKKGLI